MKKVFLCSAFTILLSAGLAIFDTTSSVAATVQTEATSQPSGAMSEVIDLVKGYFPKAKITSTDKSVHFEFKAHERQNTYSNRLEMSPDLGGIFGDIEIKPGVSKDNDKLPTEKHETIHSVLLMAPYSAPDNSHLATRLLFQPDTPNDFMLKFREVINSYKKGDVATTASAATSIATSVTTTASASTASASTAPASTALASAAPASTTPASTAPASTTSVTTTPTSTATSSTTSASTTSASTTTTPTASASTSFGAAKMSKYSYPEGRFRVLLPGSPQMKYGSQAGLRMVDYSYPEAHGTFNISYVILPQQPDPAKFNLLNEKLAESVIKSIQGENVKQFGTTLQTFPGRQIEAGQLKDKPGQSARFKIFVVRRYVYVIGVAGKKAWIDSPIANEFMSSFTVSPELTAAEQAEAKRHEFDNQFKASRDDSDKRRREFEQRFSESQSRARKEHEKFKADFDFNRRR